MRQKMEDEKAKLEAIKRRKLGELQGLGIQEKYQAELAKKKINWGLSSALVQSDKTLNSLHMARLQQWCFACNELKNDIKRLVNGMRAMLYWPDNAFF